jgi:hypothetical protein
MQHEIAPTQRHMDSLTRKLAYTAYVDISHCNGVRRPGRRFNGAILSRYRRLLMAGVFNSNVLRTSAFSYLLVSARAATRGHASPRWLNFSDSATW